MAHEEKLDDPGPGPAKGHTNGASTEDLGGGLFSNKNHALACVVRDLHERNKRAQQQKTPCEAPDTQNGAADTLHDGDVELGNGAGLWVVGGASTVWSPDLKGATQLEGAAVKAADGKQPAQPCIAPEVPPTVPNGVKGASPEPDTAGQPVPPSPPRHPPAADSGSFSVGNCFDVFKEMAYIVRLYPSTLVVPLVVFLLLTGLGIWGVIAGAHSLVQQQKDDVRSRAVDAATGFQIQLQQSFTPGVTFQLLVKQRPEWDYWLQNFNQTAEELLSRVPKGSLWNLQLQPFAQVMMIFPMRPEDESQVNPPRDLLGDTTRRDGILSAIRTRQPLVNGPFDLVQGFKGAFVRYPIYVPDRDEQDTFGFRYRGNATAIPYSQMPASVQSCNVCYNATTREKWWGILTVLVNYDQVTHGQDAYLANLRRLNLNYEVMRPVNSTYEDKIYRTDSTPELRGTDAVTVEVKAINGVWLLRVAPKGGFQASWRGPLIAAVVIIALIMSFLLFVSLASFKRQVLLLHETVAANYKLAETTEQLREEKERMDVLLVRQYDLLRCLDANRTKRTDDDSESAAGSRRAMMARIEDARRSLNVAKSAVEDPIQVFEVLGAGAFGKVQRGLWRGTVVAVKTMILPANMTGQEKRERMAVMEAAISSSLVHPNIVTTYTYFIRPYHEPTDGAVQQMPSSNSQSHGGTSMSGRSNGSDPAASTERSVISEVAIHSYEVRLVLEFCDKGSLKDALDQNVFLAGSLNLAAMLETAADVAKAMVHMHAANVLHSDLKARNIMLKSSGTEGRGVVAKVADFGLSTRMEHTETHLSSCFQGTLTHMAPEVMLEGRISKAADVYSFGILMWELFCGGDPFAGLPRAHMGHAITKEGRRPRFPPFAPRGYTELAARCWDPDAAARPSFEQVLSELERMREELGGSTAPLTIVPPAPITSGSQSGDGGGGLFRRHSPSKPGGGGGDSTSNSGLGVLGGGSGVVTRENPLAFYNAGIVVGGASTLASSGGDLGGGGSGGGGVGPDGGCSSSSGGIGRGGPLPANPGRGPSPLGHPMSPSTSSSSATSSAAAAVAMRQRAMLKSNLAKRHLHKLGIRMGGVSSSSGMGPTLAALDEESEHRESSS